MSLISIHKIWFSSSSGCLREASSLRKKPDGRMAHTCETLSSPRGVYESFDSKQNRTRNKSNQVRNV